MITPEPASYYVWGSPTVVDFTWPSVPAFNLTLNVAIPPAAPTGATREDGSTWLREDGTAVQREGGS